MIGEVSSDYYICYLCCNTSNQVIMELSTCLNRECGFCEIARVESAIESAKKRNYRKTYSYVQIHGRRKGKQLSRCLIVSSVAERLRSNRLHAGDMVIYKGVLISKSTHELFPLINKINRS
jgi:hypothetical protein